MPMTEDCLLCEPDSIYAYRVLPIWGHRRFSQLFGKGRREWKRERESIVRRHAEKKESL